MIKNIFKKFHFQRLRSQLKGARFYSKEGNPFLVENIMNSLELKDIGLDNKYLKNLFSVSNDCNLDYLIRQYLLMNYKQICAEIMQSKGEKRLAIIPLPKSWLDHLQFNGIQINYSKSYIALLKYSFFCFLKGFYRAFILFYNRSKKIRLTILTLFF